MILKPTFISFEKFKYNFNLQENIFGIAVLIQI